MAELLSLINTQEGKYLLSEVGAYSPIGKIVHITKNSYIEHIENNVYRGTFLSKHPFATILLPIFEKMRIANEYEKIDDYYNAFSHFAGLSYNRKYPHIYLATDTFNPSAGASEPVDGYVGRGSVNEVYSSIRNGAGTDSNVGTSTNSGIYLAASSTSSQYLSMYHFLYGFDTSTLTSAATISSASLTLYANEKNAGLGSPASHIGGATPASWSTLANSDYQNVGRTSFSNIAYASIADAANNEFTLDSNGIANINTSGISGFSLQDAWDINNSFTGSWSSTANTHIWYNTADSASNKPTLSVTYTVPRAAGLLLLA